MSGWITLARVKMPSVSQFFSTTYSQLKSSVRAIYISLDIGKKTYDFFMQGLDGFTRVFYPSNLLSLIRSPQTRQVMRKSFTANVFLYAGAVLFYEAGIKRALRTVQDENSYTEETMNLIAAFYFMRIGLRMYANNMVYALCVSKAVNDENPPPAGFKACEDGMAPYVKASMVSSIYYMTDLVAIHMVCSSLPFGSSFRQPLIILRTGQGLLEYKFSSLGDCYDHRVQRVTTNNAYSFGLGLSYFSTLTVLNALTERVTGVENKYLYDALANFLFHYFIVVAYLIDKPLPGARKGTDFFYYSRLVTENMMANAASWLEPRLRNEQMQGKFLRLMKNILAFPPVSLSRRALLEQELQSPSNFFAGKTGQLYLDYYGPNLKKTLEWISDLRSQQIPYQIANVSAYLPTFIVSESTTKLLNFLLSEKLGPFLERVNDFLVRADLKQLGPSVKITIRDKDKWKKISEEIQSPDSKKKSNPENTQPTTETQTKSQPQTQPQTQPKPQSSLPSKLNVPFAIIENYGDDEKNKPSEKPNTTSNSVRRRKQ